MIMTRRAAGTKRLLYAVLTLLFMCALMPVLTTGAFAEDYGCTVGAYASFTTGVPGSGDELVSATISAGALPDGMTYAVGKNGIVISGTPTKTGTYSCTWAATYKVAAAISFSINIEVKAAATPSPTAAATPTPTANTTLKITKSPTGETVTVGGSALFIARADNASSIVWRLIKPDGVSLYEAQVAPSYVDGLDVVGQGTENLELYNIPLSMNGWYVECKFIGLDGVSKEFTSRAVITVKPAPTPTPTAAPTTKPTAVPTAVPTATPAAAVASPTPTQDPLPTPTATPSAAPVTTRRSNNSALIAVLVIIMALSLIAVAAILFFLNKNKKGSAAARKPSAAKKAVGHTAAGTHAHVVGWTCPACGTVNKGRFCAQCGAKKPPAALLYQCDKCGWEPEDPTKPPKFCPECGDPFAGEDIKH